MHRRVVLKLIGTGFLVAGTGCSGSESEDIQDSDGDGVIDSEDYAPNDPEVQEKSDLVQDSPTPTPESTATSEQTPTPTATPSPAPVLFCESASYNELEDSLEIVDVQIDLSCLAGNPQVEQYGVTFENTGDMNADKVIYRIQYLDTSGTVFAESTMGFREYPAPGNQVVAEIPSVLEDGWSCEMVEDVYDAIGDARVDFVITEKKC